MPYLARQEVAARIAEEAANEEYRELLKQGLPHEMAVEFSGQTYADVFSDTMYQIAAREAMVA